MKIQTVVIYLVQRQYSGRKQLDQIDLYDLIYVPFYQYTLLDQNLDQIFNHVLSLFTNNNKTRHAISSLSLDSYHSFSFHDAVRINDSYFIYQPNLEWLKVKSLVFGYIEYQDHKKIWIAH